MEVGTQEIILEMEPFGEAPVIVELFDNLALAIVLGFSAADERTRRPIPNNNKLNHQRGTI